MCTSAQDASVPVKSPVLYNEQNPVFDPIEYGIFHVQILKPFVQSARTNHPNG